MEKESYSSDMGGEEAAEEMYGIGAVVDRTGLTAPGIRMWEKRYDAVVPRRTETNRRLYSAEDVARLRLMKLLTDRGHAIRNIAGLDLNQLRQRYGAIPVAEGAPSGNMVHGKTARVLLVGSGLEHLKRDQELLEAEIVGQHKDLSKLEAGAIERADLLVVSMETLFPENVTTVRDLVRRSEVSGVVLIYRFASSKTATGLARSIPGLSLLRAPLSGNQLRRECMVQLNGFRMEGLPGHLADPGPVPERLYDNDQLRRITKVSSAVECECPQHMAGLLQSLSAFEKYSEECEDRNPQDALLHAFLHRTTAQVRRTMEEALRHLVLTEGIELE